MELKHSTGIYQQNISQINPISTGISTGGGGGGYRRPSSFCSITQK